ncbi:hypothetical protein TSUD_85230 [Trifolium subterraneum]|uniref:Uncharacterized protein n=1 Tax=Trifolium subterraneum TaxID=3900 RepID=A0A2Z6LPT7_TRISU|nr:hypothetical protein TSUD_85230 [Trifolium subterraneum]
MFSEEKSLSSCSLLSLHLKSLNYSFIIVPTPEIVAVMLHIQFCTDVVSCPSWGVLGGCTGTLSFINILEEAYEVLGVIEICYLISCS